MSLLPIAIRRNRPKRNVSLIDGGNVFSSAIDKNGRVWSWGNNVVGQLGDNTVVCRSTPVSIGGAVKTFCQINLGDNNILAIDKNGKAWAWGYNVVGQLGDNTKIAKSTPVSVGGTVKTFCKIGGGQLHNLAIDKNGRVWAWGNNSVGQLGDNTIVCRSTPVSIGGAVKTFCQINGGANHNLAIDKNGRAWGWGANTQGRLGDNSVIDKSTPVSIVGAVKTFCQIDAGNNHSLAIDKNGRAWGWGSNGSGQLGDNTVVCRSTPVSIGGAVKTFCKISAGLEFSLAIDKNGKAWAWGSNFFGELGDNTIIAKSTPVSVGGSVKTFCEIRIGTNQSLAIDKNGGAWAWGNNSVGQLGNNTVAYRSTPVSVDGAVKTFCQIDAGNGICVVIDKNGRAWAWGANNVGQLGDNSTLVKITPVSIVGAVKTFCKISARNTHALAIDKNGKIWSWGANASGQLGDNTVANKLTPVSIVGAVKTFCQIDAGNNHSLAIDKNGRAWGWGSNGNGRLGDNTITIKSTPVSVSGTVKTFCQISAGINYSLAIDKNGRAWGWGANTNGRLGDNSVISKSTPVSIVGAVKTFCLIRAGTSNHSLAIDKDGKVWAWGANVSGQLGDNTTIQRLTPVSIGGAVKTFCKIYAGFGFSVAIDKYGRGWAWGSNNGGELGDNTTVSKSTPVSIGGAVKTFCQINPGWNHVLAIDKNGRAWTWGNNSNANYALGIIVPLTPVRVCNI